MFFFSGDAAFGLHRNLLSPFQGSLTPTHLWFNNVFSSARIIIEQAFGILTNRFRSLLGPIEGSIARTTVAVQAMIILNNYLIRTRAPPNENEQVPLTTPNIENDLFNIPNTYPQKVQGEIVRDFLSEILSRTHTN